MTASFRAIAMLYAMRAMLLRLRFVIAADISVMLPTLPLLMLSCRFLRCLLFASAL